MNDVACVKLWLKSLYMLNSPIQSNNLYADSASINWLVYHTTVKYLSVQILAREW
jgi:hypothetical protein